jgi:hypothetical protein
LENVRYQLEIVPSKPIVDVGFQSRNEEGLYVGEVEATHTPLLICLEDLNDVALHNTADGDTFIRLREV